MTKNSIDSWLNAHTQPSHYSDSPRLYIPIRKFLDFATRYFCGYTNTYAFTHVHFYMARTHPRGTPKILRSNFVYLCNVFLNTITFHTYLMH